MPVVMLFLILTPLLLYPVPLTLAGELCMLCQCLLLGQGRTRRRLALLAGAVLLPLAVWLGGGALLETAGLGWRRWVSGGLVTAAAIAAAALALFLPRELHALWPGVPRWWEWLGRICSYLTVLALAACLLLLALLGLWWDRVSEWEGETVVAEYDGIFRETGYRYVNWFVHGEQVYVWQD